MSSIKTNQARKLLRCLEEFRRLDPEMPVQQVVTFLTVALNPGVSLVQIAAMTDQAESSASRNVAVFSKLNRHKEKGFALIEGVPDPMELRRKVHTLTPRGVQLYEKVTHMIGG